MIKNYKTLDVPTFHAETQTIVVHNALITIDTSLLSEEDNRTALRLIHKLGFVKCSAVETESRQVPTFCGTVSYIVDSIIQAPSSVKEPTLGRFVINDSLVIDTNLSPLELYHAIFEQ